MIFKDGKTYNGEWVNGVYCGFGKLKTNDKE